MPAIAHISPQPSHEETLSSPACTTFNEQTSIAWASRADRHLKVKANYLGPTVTLPETGTGVALTTFRTRLQLAWTGTDANNTINLISSPDGVTFDSRDKVTLWGNAGRGPSAVEFNGRLILSWSTISPIPDQQALNFISSADGKSFDLPYTIPETSPSAPAMAVFRDRLYLAWCGTDDGGSLNVMSSADGRQFDFRHPKILADSSSTHPALCVLGDELYLVWRGRDDWKKLNVLSTRDGTEFTNRQTYQYGSLFSPALARALRKVGTETTTYLPSLGPGGQPSGGWTTQTSTTYAFYQFLILAWTANDNVQNLYTADLASISWL